MTKEAKFALDWETVDLITKNNLLDIYERVAEELVTAKEQIANGEECTMHESDIAYNTKFLIHLEQVLGYFGEKV